MTIFLNLLHLSNFPKLKVISFDLIKSDQSILLSTKVNNCGIVFAKIATKWKRNKFLMVKFC